MGVYIKGVTKQELKEIFGKACILYNSNDLVDVKTPHGRLIDEDTIPDRTLRVLLETAKASTVIESEEGE